MVPLRDRHSESKFSLPCVSHWKRSKGRCSAHTLKFIDDRAAYYETDTHYTTRDFAFGRPLRCRQAKRVHIFRQEFNSRRVYLTKGITKCMKFSRLSLGGPLRVQEGEASLVFFFWADDFSGECDTQSVIMCVSASSCVSKETLPTYLYIIFLSLYTYALAPYHFIHCDSVTSS